MRQLPSMESKVVKNGVHASSGNNAKLHESSCVERLLKMIDALNEEVKKSIAVMDDDAMLAVSSRLTRVQEVLNSEQEMRKHIPGETLEKLKQKQMPDAVKLSVGGKAFAAPLTALTSVKGTFFESMFGGELCQLGLAFFFLALVSMLRSLVLTSGPRSLSLLPFCSSVSGRWPLTPEADGTFSIGRNPKGFSMVLHYLRGATIDVKSVPDCEMAAFIEDVDYYGLPVELVEKWLGRRLRPPAERFSGEDHSDGIALAEENIVASHGPGVECNYDWVMGDNSYGGQDHVVITMRIERVGKWAMLGIIGQRPACHPQHQWEPTCYGFDNDGTRYCAGSAEYKSKSGFASLHWRLFCAYCFSIGIPCYGSPHHFKLLYHALYVAVTQGQRESLFTSVSDTVIL